MTTVEIQPIYSEADYQRALKRLSAVFDAPEGSEEGIEAELLVLLIGHYENKHVQFGLPDPVDAVLQRMEDLSLRNVDLVRRSGGSLRASHLSEMLHRKRKFTLPAIKVFHRELSLSYDLLMQDV